MREIKFRAWDKGEREFINIKSFGFLEDGEVWYVQAIDGNESEIDPPYFTGENDLVIMQYTGLRDKNGVDVYQGDIVKCQQGCPHEVIWLEEYAGIYIGGMPAWYLKGLKEGYAWSGDEEVIGNIYENPELLEESK